MSPPKKWKRGRARWPHPANPAKGKPYEKHFRNPPHRPNHRRCGSLRQAVPPQLWRGGVHAKCGLPHHPREPTRGGSPGREVLPGSRLRPRASRYRGYLPALRVCSGDRRSRHPQRRQGRLDAGGRGARRGCPPRGIRRTDSGDGPLYPQGPSPPGAGVVAPARYPKDMSVDALLSVEEYLRTSYCPDKEFRNGALVERNVGDKVHARLQALLAAYLSRRRKQWQIQAYTELRIQVRENWYPLPDVCVYALPEPEGRYPSQPPLLLI